jgi:hypothetical protein
MVVRRRSLFSLLAGAAIAGAKPSAADDTPAATTPQPSFEERLAARAAENRHRVAFDGSRFFGPGVKLLVEEGGRAQFFLLGEEHGVAENPKLCAQLWGTLASSGYERLAIEISSPMARELDRAASNGGVEGLKRLFADPGSAVAFYGMKEEAQFIADARASARGKEPLLWGMDYEVGADRRLIAMLKARRKPEAAETALAQLQAASQASWAKFAQTRDPRFMYAFSGDPALVQAVAAAWPKADPEAQDILRTLEETFAINRLWLAREPWRSNERRGAFMRANLIRHWRVAKAAGQTPRAFFKFGASHVMRGRNSTETFDIGALAHEIAALEGSHAFSLLVVPGKGSPRAYFDPSASTYKSTSEPGDYMKGLAPIVDQAFTSDMTLFDLRPLRPLLGYSRTPRDPELLRMVHGFDALLLMTGSTASTNLL